MPCSIHARSGLLKFRIWLSLPASRAVRGERFGAAEDHHQLSEPERVQLAAVSGEGRRLLPKVRTGCDADVRRDADGSRDAGERRGADGEFVAGTVDAGGVERRVDGADRELAQPRRVRADGREEHREHQGAERQAHRRRAGGRRAVRLPAGPAREIRDCRRAMCNGFPSAPM